MQLFSEDKLKRKFESDLKSQTELAVSRPNILLLGKRGVGKSSLVNRIFGYDLAEVDEQNPQVSPFEYFSVPGVPVQIIDSRGYDSQSEDRIKSQVENLVVDNFVDVSRQIHICWFCVSLTSDGLCQSDLSVIDVLRKKNIPVAIVLTKCDKDDSEYSRSRAIVTGIYKALGWYVPCFRVSTRKDSTSDYEIDKLINWSADNINDNNLRLGFIIAQKSSLEEKDKAVSSRIKWFTAFAAGVGASPLPVSDAVALTALQLKMAADIYNIYGLENTTSTLVKNLIKGKIVSTFGRMLVGNILKFIPGVGTAVGVAVNAGVAGSITFAMGKAIAFLCHKATVACWEGHENRLPEIFTEENLSRLYKQYYKPSDNPK